MKKITQDAEHLEKLLLNKIEKKSGIKLKSNCWMLTELENLLNCYPELRKYNYKKMSLEEIKALIQSLSRYLEIQYSEDNDLILVDLTEKKKLFTLRELIMWLIIASLTDKSHVHFKYSEKFLNETKVSEASAIDFLCDNSYFITQVSGFTFSQ
jgi:hemerythrin